jgi:hypothetical protein
MWNWFNCYLSGRHEYGVWCEPGNIFLRCVHCGRRSAGWSLDTKQAPLTRPTAQRTPMTDRRSNAQRIVPFERRAAAR